MFSFSDGHSYHQQAVTDVRQNGSLHGRLSDIVQLPHNGQELNSR